MTTYYVSDTNGNNSNSGDLFAPFRTISQALTRASAGDTIIVRGGTYQESISITKNRINVMSFDGEYVTIDGGWSSGVPDYSGDVKEYSSLILVSGDYVTVDGINVRNAPSRGITVSSPGCTIRNLELRNLFAGGVILHGAHDCLVQDVRILKASLRFHYLGQPWKHTDGKVTNWPHTVAPVQTQNSVWRRVEIFEHEGEGFSGYTGRNTLWENCKIVNGTKAMVYMNWSPDFVMRNCEVYFTEGFEFRVVYGNGTPRSIIFGDEHEVENRPRPNYGPTKNVQIYNNAIIGADISLAIGDGNNRSVNAENVLIANNTIIAARGGNAIQIGEPNQLAAHPRTWSNIRIENNIFIGAVRSTITSQQHKNAFTFKHNYWSETPPNWMQGTGDVGGDIHLVSSALPILLDDDSTTEHDNFRASNYSPTALSPTVNAGTKNEVNTVDYNGTLRDTTPDIGFYEYTDGSPVEIVITANFTMSASVVGIEQTIFLTEASYINVGNIDTYLWEYRRSDVTQWTQFSDEKEPPPFSSAEYGTYEIRLTVGDLESGEIDSFTSSVNIQDTLELGLLYRLIQTGTSYGARIGVTP